MKYGRYFQHVFGKWKPFERKKKHYPCPGCIRHCEIVGKHRGNILFRKYVNRPAYAKRLYWNSHPDEYRKLIKLFENEK